MNFSYNYRRIFDDKCDMYCLWASSTKTNLLNCLQIICKEIKAWVPKFPFQTEKIYIIWAHILFSRSTSLYFLDKFLNRPSPEPIYYLFELCLILITFNPSFFICKLYFRPILVILGSYSNFWSNWLQTLRYIFGVFKNSNFVLFFLFVCCVCWYSL